MSDRGIPVVELFGPTIQGEGAVAGQVSIFVRTGGCPLRCAWCDSPHAVDPRRIKAAARWIEHDTLIEDVVTLVAKADEEWPGARGMWVTLTGGDPVMWDLSRAVCGLRLCGFRVAVETQATLWRDWLEDCELVTCSPKPPSSGMDGKLDIPVLQKYWARLQNKMVLKIVVFDDADFEFAARLHAFLPSAKLYLSAGTPQTDYVVEVSRKLDACIGYQWLCERVTADPRFHDAVVGMQMHVLAWGTELGR